MIVLIFICIEYSMKFREYRPYMITFHTRNMACRICKQLFSPPFSVVTLTQISLALSSLSPLLSLSSFLFLPPRSSPSLPSSPSPSRVLRYEVKEIPGSQKYKTHMLLTIKSVTKADIGEYNCIANNSQGGAEQVVRVAASDPMPPNNRNALEKGAGPGGGGEGKCQGGGGH